VVYLPTYPGGGGVYTGVYLLLFPFWEVKRAYSSLILSFWEVNRHIPSYFSLPGWV